MKNEINESSDEKFDSQGAGEVKLHHGCHPKNGVRGL